MVVHSHERLIEVSSLQSWNVPGSYHNVKHVKRSATLGLEKTAPTVRVTSVSGSTVSAVA